jgi:hypothetical protein
MQEETTQQTTFFSQQIQIVVRGTDMLTVVNVEDNSSMTSRDVRDLAVQQSNIPNFDPDGIGAVLIFHTESGEFVLGGVRSNPALKEKFIKDNISFPDQMNTTIGGRLANPDLPLRESVMKAIKNKIFLESNFEENTKEFEALTLLKKLSEIIENNEGWESKICIHTDKCVNKDGTEGTMCYLTTIKHINCSDEDLIKIREALQTIMIFKEKEGIDRRTLSKFEFVPLKPIIEYSLETYVNDEITKAKNAYEKFGNRIAITFNDLSIATFAKNNAFINCTQFAQLNLETSLDKSNENCGI